VLSPALFSSATCEWATPRDLFIALNHEFSFTLDVCATAENAVVPKFFTEQIDGLAQDWTGDTWWCNPPYGRGIGKWTRKAALSLGSTGVMLLPARTDTAWWNDDVLQADEIRFIRGRLHFGGAASGAPFPSALAIFRPRILVPRLRVCDTAGKLIV
jgi:phage N-6-adenine-methyltransferase